MRHFHRKITNRKKLLSTNANQYVYTLVAKFLAISKLFGHCFQVIRENIHYGAQLILNDAGLLT